MPLQTPSTPGVHEVLLNQGNGMGSTNNTIRRFTTTVKNVGTAIVYTDSALTGAAFTITMPGTYSVGYGDGGVGDIAISVNADITVGSATITPATRYGLVSSVGFGYVSATMRLEGGDIVRPHIQQNQGGGASAYGAFRILRVAN